MTTPTDPILACMWRGALAMVEACEKPDADPETIRQGAHVLAQWCDELVRDGVPALPVATSTLRVVAVDGKRVDDVMAIAPDGSLQLMRMAEIPPRECE